MTDVRYIQRFENFEKSFFLLKGALAIEAPSIVEKGGVIQFFETTFELAWKLMKDYMEFQGYDVNSPRQAIKHAFTAGLIENGTQWLEALTDRNLTVHTYDEVMANAVYDKIRNQYSPLIVSLYNKFKGELCTD